MEMKKRLAVKTINVASNKLLNNVDIKKELLNNVDINKYDIIFH